MTTYRIKLYPLGPWATPFQADTLFGHLAWIVRKTKGESELEDFLMPFRDGSPNFLLSDAFFGDNLPFPQIAPDLMGKLEGEYSDFKSFKKERDLSYTNFKALISDNPSEALKVAFDAFVEKRNHSNKEISSGIDKKSSLCDQVNLHNSIDRRTFTTPSEGGLYPLKETFCSPGDYLTLYVRCESDMAKRLYDLLVILGEIGYGKKRTIGRGAFEIKEAGFEPVEGLDYSGGDFVTLAPFIPENGQIDLDKSRYSLRLKKGRLGEDFANNGHPFAKRPFQMIAPGSVIKPASDNQKVFGRALGKEVDLIPGGEGVLEKVIHYAYAFPVGVKNLP